jgi:hypothetical protein
MKKYHFNQPIADYAAFSGRLATFIGDRSPSVEEQKMMDRLLEFHESFITHAVRYTG